MTLEEALKKLKSENCPAGLRLNLGWNDIGNEGAKALAYALKSGNCPSGLHLVLCSNGITDLGAQALADAVNTGNCRFGTKIDLKKNEYDIAELSRKNDVIIHQAALGIAILVGGFLQDNMRVRTSPQSRLPLDVIDNISKFLPGHISAIKIAAYLKKSFIHLMKTNSGFSQKHRSHSPVNQHLYDKQHGLSLWRCSGNNGRGYMNNYTIMDERVMPRHSIK
jgi:hypothetical protein